MTPILFPRVAPNRPKNNLCGPSILIIIGRNDDPVEQPACLRHRNRPADHRAPAEIPDVLARNALRATAGRDDADVHDAPVAPSLCHIGTRLCLPGRRTYTPLFPSSGHKYLGGVPSVRATMATGQSPPNRPQAETRPYPVGVAANPPSASMTSGSASTSSSVFL